MKGQIIAFANQKGGVGKTTLTIHAAAWLVTQNKRVIVVDGDPQGNTTSWLLDGDVSDPGLFRLLVVKENLGQVVRSLNDRWGGLGLLPGNDQTGEAMIFLAATRKPFNAVAKALRPLAEVTDYVLVDTPPSKAAGFWELLFATDWVVVPTQLERLSLEGVSFMAHTCQSLRKEHRQGPRLLGIVPNMVRRTREHLTQLEELQKVFGAAVWPPVPLTVRVSEACAYGETIFEFAPQEKAAKALCKVAQRILENTGGGNG